MGTDDLKPKVIVICGPTGLGKTAAGIELARVFQGEIVSADSMQIYRHMDIGTAKPTPDEQAIIPHHMVDIVDPDEPFDAARFSEMAREVIKRLHARHITPFVVGGTGLYIKALIYGLFSTKPANPDVRVRLKAEAELQGIGFLYKRLKSCDPETAEKLHPNDTYRIIRALEIYEKTGDSISKHHMEHRFSDNPFEVLKIGLEMNRELLYERINSRVDAMIDADVLDEVKGLLDMGYSGDLKSMQSIGYRHMVDYIMGRLSWEETVGTMKRDTRRYAKRQLTWFRADSEIVWAEPGQLNKIRQLIKEFRSRSRLET